MAETVLVLAVHPDDETLGCGGTLLKHKSQGDLIHWLIVTSISVDSGFTQQQAEKRAEEIEQVAKLYNFDSIEQLNLPPAAVDTLATGKLIQVFSDVINKIKPTIIYLPCPFDVHSDHRVAFEAIYSCTKAFRYPFIKRIYLMETLSETEFAPPFPGQTFTPNCFVDISQFIELKQNIAAIYKSEMGVYPFPRSPESIKALAMCRGSNANCKYAESFMLIKEIR